MKKAARLSALFLFVLWLLPTLFSCQEITEENISSETWTLVSSGPGFYNGEKWSITNETITYSSCWVEGGEYTVAYKADIISSAVDAFNALDSTFLNEGVVPTGSHGYMVIQFTEVDNAGWGEVGKYDVFRWQTNSPDPSARDFTVGIKLNGDFENQVFDTAEAAETGATNAAGYFDYGSSGANR